MSGQLQLSHRDRSGIFQSPETPTKAARLIANGRCRPPMSIPSWTRNFDGQPAGHQMAFGTGWERLGLSGQRRPDGGGELQRSHNQPDGRGKKRQRPLVRFPWLDQQLGQVNSPADAGPDPKARPRPKPPRARGSHPLVRNGHAETGQSGGWASPLINQYRQAGSHLWCRQMAQMQSRYGSEHPKMLDMQASKRDPGKPRSRKRSTIVVGTVNNGRSGRPGP